MKRNIAVKEKELIDKLNKHLNEHVDPEVHVDTAEGDDKTVVTIWDEENEKIINSWNPEDNVVHSVLPKVPNGEIDIDLDPTKNMTDEEKERFNMWGPCSLEEVGGDYQDEEESDFKNLTDAQKAERYNKFMKELKKACGKREYTQMRPQDIMDTEYEYVNHPKHYNNYDVEVIDMMERIFGVYETYAFCKLNAYKYRMRAGTKPHIDVKQDLDKEKWYLNKAKELKDKMKRYKKLEDNALL